MNNPPFCAIDEEDGNLSNDEQKANEKKNKEKKEEEEANSY